MTSRFGALDDPRLDRPPPGPIPWLVWRKDAPDEHGAIVVYAQLWSEANAEGCRRLGVPYVDGRQATAEEAARAASSSAIERCGL